MATNNYHRGERVWTRWATTSASTTLSDYYYQSNDDIWSNWQSTSGSTTVSTTSNTIWYDWNRDYARGGTTVIVRYNDVAWETWISDEQVVLAENPKAVLKETIGKVFKIKTKSQEEIRAENAQRTITQEWNKILSEERAEETRLAEVTAQELLLELVGEEEMARYKETGRLFVKGKKYDYVLRKGGGVHRIIKDKVVDFAKRKKGKGKYICVHPKESYNFPESDNIISLKLWIENAEEEFLKIGNIHSSETDIEQFDKIVGL